MEPCPNLLLCLDPTAAEEELAGGRLACPHPACSGRLRPWGHGRGRVVRLAGARTEHLRARRARCGACRRTQVLAPCRTFPRRADAVEVVASALVAAADGEGHRRVAAPLDRPPSTVRDWLRRARANAESVRAAATAALYDFDSTAGAVVPRGSPLADMLEAVGLAVAAAIRRLGPVAAPWQLALSLTRAAILAPAPRRVGVPAG